MISLRCVLCTARYAALHRRRKDTFMSEAGEELSRIHNTRCHRQCPAGLSSFSDLESHGSGLTWHSNPARCCFAFSTAAPPAEAPDSCLWPPSPC